MTILCIDDERSMLACYQTAMDYLGLECLTAQSADAGIALLKATPDVALVTLDIKMPGKNGFEAYRELRAFSNVPVLFATAYPASFSAETEQFVRMWQDQFADGTTDILYKPFDFDVLREKMESLIGPLGDSSDVED